jgi:polysaccharide export outer membrane protein
MVLVPNLLGVPESEAGANASAASEIDQARYVIGSEDVLHISVWREDGLTRQVRVRPDGRISFPLVGDVQAAGLTAPQLQAELTRLLQSYVTAPAVSVIVDEVNSYKIYVVGEVERPGALALKTPVTVLQALALAGGLKPFAHGNRMVLVRERDGKTVRVRLNYRDLVLGRNGAVNLTLESGDTLVVP